MIPRSIATRTWRSIWDLLVYYSVSGRTPYVVLAAVATAGSVMVSYARARAESLIPLCKVGFMERPERMVLLIIGGVFNRMGPVLWVIAVISTITVIHRIIFTWQETKAGRILPNLRTQSIVALHFTIVATIAIAGSYMRKVGSREFKNRMGRYLSAVRNGQSLLITDRGIRLQS